MLKANVEKENYTRTLTLI